MLISNSANECALLMCRQLLNECGIGVNEGDSVIDGGAVVSQHRVLLFCQYKAMLDIIEKHLFQ